MKKTLGLCVVLTASLMLACVAVSESQAACTGSGLAWTCTAGSTAAQINAAISSAANEAVITFDAGTYSFTGVNLANKNGLSLVCATLGGCTNSGSGTIFSLETCSAPVTNLVRIGGWNFTVGGGYKIWIYCNQNITQLRLDHLDITGHAVADIAIFIGEGSTPASVDLGQVWGVADHINCHSATTNFVCIKHVSGGMTWTTGTQGTAQNFFFEDSVCDMFRTAGDFGTGCIDNWRAHGIVARFNTVLGTVLRTHSYCHGGPYNTEMYGNLINTQSVASPGGWDIHLQGGGETIVWGNQAGPQGGGLPPLGVQNYRSTQSALPQGSCTIAADGTVVNPPPGTPQAPYDTNRTPTASYYGYPTWHQAGRDGNVTLKPMYSFLNRINGTGALVNLQVSSGTWTGSAANCANNDTNRINCHMQLNRDIYHETPSFTGVSGVGVGTLAARPATCTPTPEAADAGNGGVGYWATDQGSWNQSTSNPYGVQQNGADGVLYRCSATNTWTVAYTPYTYPHPLATGAEPPPVTPQQRWSPIMNLRVAWEFLAEWVAWIFLPDEATAGELLLAQATAPSLSWSIEEAPLACSVQTPNTMVQRSGSQGGPYGTIATVPITTTRWSLPLVGDNQWYRVATACGVSNVVQYLASSVPPPTVDDDSVLQAEIATLKSQLAGICRAAKAMGGSSISLAGRLRKEIPCL